MSCSGDGPPKRTASAIGSASLLVDRGVGPAQTLTTPGPADHAPSRGLGPSSRSGEVVGQVVLVEDGVAGGEVGPHPGDGIVARGDGTDVAVGAVGPAEQGSAVGAAH